MTPEEARAELARCIAGTDPDVIMTNANIVERIVAAWRALDDALSSGGALPEAWARLTATRAAERAGKNTHNNWLTLVEKGYAPPADGHDENGRAFWHPVTIDAYRAGEFTAQPVPRPAHLPPPSAGPGSGRDAWAAWATERGITVLPRMRRAAIREECRKAGLIE